MLKTTIQISNDIVQSHDFRGEVQSLVQNLTLDQAKKILSGYVSADMIDMTDADCILNTMKKENIIRNHPYKASQSGSKNRWRIQVGSGKERKFLYATDLDTLYDKLVEYYLKSSEDADKTFEAVWQRYLNEHTIGLAPGTAKKYASDYLRFFNESSIEKKPIASIRSSDLIDFVQKVVSEKKLCPEATKGLLCYLSGTFERALDEELIENNPMERLLQPRMKKKFMTLSVKKERDLERILVSTDDWSVLSAHLREKITEHPEYMPDWAVIFLSMTGCRMGEVSPLKWSDIQTDLSTGISFIAVTRSESYDPVSHTYSIRDVKNHKPRVVPIHSLLETFLYQLKTVQTKAGLYAEDGWMFPDITDGHIHKNPIRDCLRNRCKQVGITPKGTHAFRRQINSDMLSAGGSQIMVASIIGNSPRVNSRHYTFDTSGLSEKKKVIEIATQKRTQVI